jgi:integrase
MGGKATITTVTGQAALPVRDAVYWHKLHAGQHLGLRKTKTSQTWYARAYDGERQVRKALGAFDHLPPNERFSAASKEAEQWFKHLDAGGSMRGITVLEACERYVQALRDDPEKGDASADAEAGYVRRFIAKDKLADLPVDKLVKAHVQDWRRRMERKPVAQPKRGKHCRNKEPLPPARKRKPVSVNRNMVTLRAALNLAKADGFVTSDLAWAQALKPIKGVANQRTLYLDRGQRKALVAALPDDAGRFVRGLCELPLRPGALAALTVADYDARHKLLCIGHDKAGEGRYIPLPPATAKLIADNARGKLPAASLFARWDGAAWSKDAWMKAIREAVVAADLPPTTTAYTLRHSTITDLVTGGLDLHTVAKVSGTSVAMIEKYYGKLRQDVARDALAALAL